MLKTKLWKLVQISTLYLACERRRISGCHLVPPKNNVCEPEPENDFCDVGILSQSQFSSNNPRTTARLCARYSLRGALEFHSITESDWPRRNKSHYVTEIVSWLGFADIIFRRNQVTAGNTSALAGYALLSYIELKSHSTISVNNKEAKE